MPPVASSRALQLAGSNLPVEPRGWSLGLMVGRATHAGRSDLWNAEVRWGEQNLNSEPYPNSQLHPKIATSNHDWNRDVWHGRYRRIASSFRQTRRTEAGAGAQSGRESGIEQPGVGAQRPGGDCAGGGASGRTLPAMEPSGRWAAPRGGAETGRACEVRAFAGSRDRRAVASGVGDAPQPYPLPHTGALVAFTAPRAQPGGAAARGRQLCAHLQGRSQFDRNGSRAAGGRVIMSGLFGTLSVALTGLSVSQ